MKAVLKRTHSPDVFDLSAYTPKNPQNFGFLLQAMIGPESQDGEESFDMVVCTPLWLLEQHRKEDAIIGRHHLIVFEYNYKRIIDTINSFLESCTGATWTDVAEKVGRLGKWEFEDYRNRP